MKKPVLVVGGGIAGIQASLDLAEMNVPVFLVEESPSIGGRMAQLDKTFPTNDCSACILAPKVTECFNHPLVKTLTWSEVEVIKGAAPDFTAVIRQKARFVDEESCIGCGACTRKCPIERPNEFDAGLATRGAVYKPYAQAVPNKVVIEKLGTSPCRSACPAQISAHGCVSLIAEKRFDEAVNLIRQVTPFVGVLGLLCEGHCKTACYRQYVDEGVGIPSLHEFLGRYAQETDVKFKPRLRSVQTDQRAVVVGGGPSALNAAYQLALAGVAVEIISRDAQLGGQLRWELSESDHNSLLDEEIAKVTELVTNVTCGASESACAAETLTKQGFDAVVYADSESLPAKLAGQTGNVFVGGEASESALSPVEAVAAGNRLAAEVLNYLLGENRPVDAELLPTTPMDQVNFTEAVLDSKPVYTEYGLSEEQAAAEAQRCLDCSICSECRACEFICPPKSIRHEQRDEILELDVSAVLMACGYKPTDEIPDAYGYGVYSNVVTSLEYERILNASGPFEGHVQRPSDGQEPKRIAFLQCVGSRDMQCGADYCSAVCCMYAIKEAVITKEHMPAVDAVDIYYMDMRAYGKDFDKYLTSAEQKGVGFIRSRVAEVIQDPVTKNLIVRHTDPDGFVVDAEYDLVVLSVGMKMDRKTTDLLRRTGIKTDAHGFCWVDEMSPPETSVPGVYACGALAGPKDIPETVVEAGAAAASAARIAGTREVERDRYALFFAEKEEKPIQDVSKEPMRIGVFVCHCGSNIGGFLDVKAVAKYARTLPFVMHAADFTYACSLDSQKMIADRIRKHKLNRVVVASCTPRTHEKLFQEVMVDAGLNPYMFTMANIREQCSWVHMEQYDAGTEKAKELVRMGVGKATFAKQLTRSKLDVDKSALVVGGGAAGMAAALELADLGYPVHLLEKTDALGGHASRLAYSPHGRPVRAYVDQYKQRLEQHPLVTIHCRTSVEAIDGYVGNFTTAIRQNGRGKELKHGVVIVAVGASEAEPKGFGWGHPSVITQLDLEERLQNEVCVSESLRSAAFIQCVGSRSDERPYCSRVCCGQTLKNAVRLKEATPDMHVVVFYRDIRSYGLYEVNYRRARQLGVQFVRYDAGKEPRLFEDAGQLYVKALDPLLQEEFSTRVDLVVLSSAVAPNVEQNRQLGQMLKVPLNQDGFFLEAHAKLQPVDFATDGVYLCGLAHGPKNMRESIVQGKAAAARAAAVISKSVLETEGIIARVSEQFCTGCGTCELVCAYKAVSVEEQETRSGKVQRAVVNDALCKGCGTCAAACRCGAMDIDGFSDRQVLNEIDFLLR